MPGELAPLISAVVDRTDRQRYLRQERRLPHVALGDGGELTDVVTERGQFGARFRWTSRAEGSGEVRMLDMKPTHERDGLYVVEETRNQEGQVRVEAFALGNAVMDERASHYAPVIDHKDAVIVAADEQREQQIKAALSSIAEALRS